MALHGKQAAVWMDNYDLSQYWNEAALDISVDTAETSTFQGTYKTFIEGLASGKFSVKGFYDKTNDAYLQTNIQDGGSVLTYIPAGSAIPPAVGDVARLGWIHDQQLTETSPVGGVVLAASAYLTDAPIGYGWVLHNIATVDTGTTTGANKDDGAATTTGWHMHLHVVAVTGAPTSVTIKLVDASASNFSDVADVTGGGFTANNAPTGWSQRLSSASGATLRRYIRYVCTFSGGTAPTITFGLAYSRN